jgi:hypothetical protein
MSIVSSLTIIDGHTQPGGGRYVIERHTDSTGKVHQIGPYLAADGFDTNARLTAQAALLLTQLQADELLDVLEGLLNPNELAHIGKAELASRIRELCASKTGIELCEIASRVLATVESGKITDTEWRTAFGLNVSQWNNVKTQMGVMRTNLNAVKAAVGF